MKQVTKIKTGIIGLDKMLRGGFLEGRNIWLSGPAGTGKTTIAMQFVYNGAMKHNEPGLYVTLEENKKKIYEDMAKFGLDLKKAEKKRKFFLIGGPIASITSYMDDVDAKINHIIREIEDVIKEKKIKRVAIDSINLFTMLLKDAKERRTALAALGNMLSSCGCTSILTSETKEGSMDLSRYGMEEFVVDGVLVLYLQRQGEQFMPGIVIRKMRGTDHEKSIKLYKITNKGVMVYPEETMFTNI